MDYWWIPNGFLAFMTGLAALDAQRRGLNVWCFMFSFATLINAAFVVLGIALLFIK